MAVVTEYLYAGQYNPNVPVLPDQLLLPLPGRQVVVRSADDASLATLYTSRTKAVAAPNPVSIDGDGNLTFFTAPGQYTLHLLLDGGIEGVGQLVTVDIDPLEASTDEDIIAEANRAIAAEDALDIRVTALEAGGGGGAGLQGTWAAMQAFPDPPDGQIWWTNDQWIEYRYSQVLADAGLGLRAWQRQCGNPLDSWVTDFGAVAGLLFPSGAVMTANVVAIYAAMAAAQASLASRDVVFPRIGSGHAYWVNAPIEPNFCRLVGHTGSGYGQFDRSLRVGLDGTAIAVGQPTLLIHNAQSVEVEGLAISNHTEPVRVQNFALWSIRDCSLTFDDNSNVNSSGLHIENAFWGLVERVDINYIGASGKGIGILGVTSFGQVIQGIAQTHFSDIITGNATIFEYQNRLTSGFYGNDSADISFHKFTAESVQGPIFRTVSDPGALFVAGINGVTISHGGIADPTAINGRWFFEFGANTFPTSWKTWNLEQYAQYTFKLIGAGLRTFEIDGGDNLSALMEPSSTPGNVYGLRVNGTATDFMVSTFTTGETPVYAVSILGEATPRWFVDSKGVTHMPASTVDFAALNMPPGVAPTSPVNGDIWPTAAALFIQRAGATRQIAEVGPTRVAKADGATTVNVSGKTLVACNDSAPTNVTAVSGNIDGQLITFTAANGNTTLKHQTFIHLAGGADFVMTQYDTITLMSNNTDGVVVEVSRSVNS